MLDDPTITVNAPTSVTVSTARLQSYLDNSGGDTCTAAWGYGLVDQGNNIAAYTYHPAAAGAWDTGSNPYLDVSSLTAGATYYYNVEANNGTYSDTGTSTSFVVPNGISEPTSVSAVATGTTVVLSWVKGTGAPQTKVRFMVNACPTDNVTGTELPITTESTYTHTGLTQGNDYCYWLAGYDPLVGYSASAVTIHATTVSENLTSSTISTAPVFPTGFLSDPSTAKVEDKFILDPIMQVNAESIGMPLNWAYLIACIIVSGFLSVVGFIMKPKPLVPLGIFTVGLLVGFVMGIVPGFGILIIVLIDVGVIILEIRGVV
jgi:hypothetical protein